ncbi:hypothetical protein [Nocardia sp. NRRL S-836]|uniref:hypothetical protein n=1 Tax=Nocardia sp. NRRL S-836 TaxID=1519492 RepID=UPI0006ADFC01|nr:hypothetical protein [Nocardia sp. NRRL S-836]KOV79245.1 hypothetical protein ADL03_37695 [Nocardia sp. NRRL S-836]
MHTRWRWVLFGLGAAVAACGPVAAAGGPWYGYVFGGLWFLMGATVAWRSFGMGTKLTEQGIQSHGIDHVSAIQWCDVQAIEPERRRNLVVFHTIAPAVQAAGRKRALSELSLLSVKKDAVPERTLKQIAELEKALAEHRAGCTACGAQPKAPEQRGLVARLRRAISRKQHRSAR